MCKLADDIYGPCEGPILRLNENDHRRPTIYCERHARMVTAWIQTAEWRDVRPIFQWLKKLDADGLKKLEETMQTVVLDSFVPYISTEKKYQVIKQYIGYLGEVPIVLPVGTILSWWDERGFYLSSAVNGYCVPVDKWAVESWHDYFEPLK